MAMSSAEAEELALKLLQVFKEIIHLIFSTIFMKNFKLKKL